jgi:hypothetical protein
VTPSESPLARKRANCRSVLPLKRIFHRFSASLQDYIFSQGMVFLCVPRPMRRWQDGALIDEDTCLARAGLISARWPGSVFLATTEAFCGGYPVEAQYGALRQKLLLVASSVLCQINRPHRTTYGLKTEWTQYG